MLNEDGFYRFLNIGTGFSVIEVPQDGEAVLDRGEAKDCPCDQSDLGRQLPIVPHSVFSLATSCELRYRHLELSFHFRPLCDELWPFASQEQKGNYDGRIGGVKYKGHWKRKDIQCFCSVA